MRVRRYADEAVETAVRTEDVPPAPAAAAATPSGARSGALMAAASLVGIVLNYVFLLAAGRFLGPEDYGALAAVVGLLTVILLPTGGVQMAVSRDVARLLGRGDRAGADAFARAALRLGVLGALPLLAIGLLLAGPIALVLDIPIAMAGVLEGRVVRGESAAGRGMGGVTLMLKHRRSGQVRRFVTFTDGDFYLMGVTAGDYELSVDPQSLHALAMTAEPVPLTLAPGVDGVGRSGVVLVLKPKS